MKKATLVFLFALASFLTSCVPVPAQPLTIANAPYCPVRFTDASTLQFAAVNTSNDVTFNFNKSVTWIDLGLEIYQDSTGFCPYRFQAIPLANDCTTPICTEHAWDVPIWYRNDAAGFTSITIPFNSYPPPSPGCYYCYAQAGGGIVTDGISRIYYAHFFDSNTWEEFKIVFSYAAPVQVNFGCAPGIPPVPVPLPFPGNEKKIPPGQKKKNH